MAKLNNYIVFDLNHCLTDTWIDVGVAGVIDEEVFYSDSRRVVINRIKGFKKIIEPENVKVEIFSKDDKYILGKKHPDYIAYLNAVKAGYPILREWELVGNRNLGYTIQAKLQNKIIFVDIYYQDSNFIFDKEGRGYFVDWFSWSKVYMEKIRKERKLLDIEYKNFEKFCGYKCRPRLQF